MNRHQSNPFLFGWETSNEPSSEATSKDDGNIESNCTTDTATPRRHSTSQADLTGNPFRTQRSVDRRLYMRNMSSFEAASLQLEHQQQLQENGSLSANQADMISKLSQMTADFQSAIETNDKQFITNVGNLGETTSALGFNPFDPFETIVDDDVSLQSPGLSANGQADKSVNQDSDDHINTCRPEDMNLYSTTTKNTHDSIDDDEEDLVSTPVRNIKASQMTTDSINEDDISKIASSERAMTKHDRQLESEEADSVDSITKATMFASLLASAEATNSQTTGREKSPEVIRASDNEVDQEDSSMPLNSIENATHVIKGVNSSTDVRPVSFFDPFETVVDKDALTSLMNDTQSAAQEDIQKLSKIDGLEVEPTKVPQPTPVHKSHLDKDQSLTPNESRLRFGHEVESASVETVIENTQIDLNQSTTDGKNDNQPSFQSVPRPKRSEVLSTVNQPQEVPKITPSRKVNRQKKRSSFQEDSSDSSEDDDRIQIIIKARDTNNIEQQASSVLVPLLPPPPSKSSMKQARERGQVEDVPCPIMSYKTRAQKGKAEVDSFDEDSDSPKAQPAVDDSKSLETKADQNYDDDYDGGNEGEFVIPMTHSDDDGEAYEKPDTPLYDEDTSYVLEEYPAKYEGPGWEMMLRYPPKKKLTSNRFWKKIFVKLAQVPLTADPKSSKNQEAKEAPQMCIALQIYDKPDDKKPMQEIPIQATYTVSDISSQQFDQFGKIFTIKLQYIFYKERVGVRQGQLARFMHTGHIGSSTTSGGHGVDPISIGAIKRMGAPIEHSPQISQIIKLGCTSYQDIKQFKNCLEDHLFKMPIGRDRALSTYKTEEVQMAVRDETYLELNQVGTILKQLARVRLFFLSFLNGMPVVEVGINDIHRQGREVVGRMDILPVVTEEWIRLEAWELHSTVNEAEFENPDSRIIKLSPPDATFFELMRFRIRPPRNRELPLQINANMSVTRTKVSINCEVMVPGCVSRKHGQIPCENVAIKIWIPECWIYFFREERHFRMGSKKSVNRRPGKVKGIERFLGGGGLQDINDESSLIEVTSGQAKYEHHHHAIVWRATRWPKESQTAYVQNTMKIRLPLTAYDKMPDNFYEYVHVEYSMPATTVSHTTLRSISVNPCDDEPPEKYVKYSAKYEYKVKMRLSVNLGSKTACEASQQPEASPIVIIKQPEKQGDLQREEDSVSDSDDDDVDGDASNLGPD